MVGSSRHDHGIAIVDLVFFLAIQHKLSFPFLNAEELINLGVDFISDLFTGQNHRNPLWADIVESGGDRATDRPSHGMKLQMNAYRWLAEPARDLADLGTHVQEPFKPIQFPAKVTWDGPFAPAVARGVQGIFGAHTAYSDGRGTVGPCGVSG